MGFPCEYFSSSTCMLLGEPCFRQTQQTVCDFYHHYKVLTPKPGDPAITKALKDVLLPIVIDKWREYAKKEARTGMKDMTSKPLEDCIINELQKQLGGIGCRISGRKKISALGGIKVIPDCIIEKEGKPTSLISIKVWIGPGASIRDAFTYGYFTKVWFGQKNVRNYVVALYSYALSNNNKNVILNACKPYLDGIYFISEPPYIDDLINELKDLYT